MADELVPSHFTWHVWLACQSGAPMLHVQENGGRTRTDSSALRAHLDTLLLTHYGLKWNAAFSLPNGQVYKHLNNAYRQHLDLLDDLPQSPVQRLASAARDLLQPSESLKHRQQRALMFDEGHLAVV